MALSAMAYQARYGDEPGFFSEVGLSFVSGALQQSVGMGRGREIVGLSSGGWLGGGRRNRFVLGARSGALEMVGGRMLGLPKPTGGFFGRLAGRAVGIGWTGYQAYQGYQRGGVWGALKAGASEVAVWGAMRAVGEVAGASVLGGLVVPIAVGAAAAYGGFKALEYGQERTRGLRNTEFVTSVMDPYGTGYTMRQRSLMAIQKSSLNGRIAMGNEAVLLGSGRDLR